MAGKVLDPCTGMYKVRVFSTATNPWAYVALMFMLRDRCSMFSFQVGACLLEPHHDITQDADPIELRYELLNIVFEPAISLPTYLIYHATRPNRVDEMVSQRRCFV